MRLIDADALFNWCRFKLSDAVKYGNKDAEQQGFSYGTLMMYEIAYEIDEAPTIDAVPVVRGEWEYEHGARCCSKCGENNPYGVDYETNRFAAYCPNCGAKMEDKPCG